MSHWVYPNRTAGSIVLALSVGNSPIAAYPCSTRKDTGQANEPVAWTVRTAAIKEGRATAIVCDDAHMTWLPSIDVAFRARVLAQDDAACKPWLDAISEVSEEVAQRWRLERSGEPLFGGASIVIPVLLQNAHPAALKLASPIADARAEHRALSALAGHGAVEVYDADLEHSALLLEHIPGPTLVEHTHPEDPLHAAAMAGGVAKSIASAPAPDDAPRLADGIEKWLAQLDEQHAEAHRMGAALPEDMFAAAVHRVQRLGESHDSTLTHGDLSFANIMRRSPGEWVAIDPSYLAGPRENEAHTILRSTLTSIIGSTDPVATMADLNRSFCEAASADDGLALDISYARFVASYYWEAQHHGDPVNIENLRTATRYAGQLLA